VEELRTPVGRSDFKSDERRQTSLVGSTPALFRQFLDIALAGLPAYRLKGEK
jgi:hypothetical protein